MSMFLLDCLLILMNDWRGVGCASQSRASVWDCAIAVYAMLRHRDVKCHVYLCSLPHSLLQGQSLL